MVRKSLQVEDDSVHSWTDEKEMGGWWWGGGACVWGGLPCWFYPQATTASGVCVLIWAECVFKAQWDDLSGEEGGWL